MEYPSKQGREEDSNDLRFYRHFQLGNTGLLPCKDKSGWVGLDSAFPRHSEILRAWNTSYTAIVEAIHSVVQVVSECSQVCVEAKLVQSYSVRASVVNGRGSSTYTRSSPSRSRRRTAEE